MIINILLTDELKRVWSIPIHTVIESKAQYLKERRGESLENMCDYVRDQFEHDHYEAEDWMRGNMEWDELGAVLVYNPPAPAEPEDWNNAQINFVEDK